MRSLLALALLPIAFADTVTVNGEKTEGVYVTESKTMYFVADPATGKVRSLAKEGVTVTISEDHDALKKAWLEKQQTIETKPLADTRQSDTKNENQAENENSAPITIKAKGQYFKDPEVSAIIDQNRANREQLRYELSPQGRYDRALEREIKARARAREHNDKKNREYFDKFGKPNPTPDAIAIYSPED